MTLFIAVPGVSCAIDALNLPSLSRASHSAASLVLQQCAMITTNPDNVQITIVSRNTPTAEIIP